MDSVIPNPNVKKYEKLLILSLLSLVNLVNYIDRFSIPAVLHELRKFFNDLDEDLAGLTQTVFVIGFMLSSPIFGFFGDRYDRKHSVIVGVLIWVIAAELGTLAPPNRFWSFLISRAIAGVGEAGYATVAPSLIADCYTGRARSRAFMVFYLAIPVGFGLGYVICPSIAAAANDWRWAVRSMPLLALVIALLFIATREPTRSRETTADSRGVVRKFSSQVAVNYTSGSIGFWFAQVAALGQQTIQPGYKTAKASQTFGIIGIVGGACGTLLGSTLSQFLSRSSKTDAYLCAIGMLTAAVCDFIALVLTNRVIEVAWTLMFVESVAICFTFPIVPDMLMYIVKPERRSTATAIQTTTSLLLGSAASPYIIGAISRADRRSDSTVDEYLALQHAIMSTAAVGIAGFGFFLFASLSVDRDRDRAENSDVGDSTTVTAL